MIGRPNQSPFSNRAFSHQSSTLLFPKEPSWWRKLPKDVGMRTAGRIGAACNSFLGSIAGDTLGILTYHRITDRISKVPAPLHNVAPARFRKQIGGLLDRGFQFWTLSDVMQHRLEDREVPARTVVLTFDDGFASVYTQAYPSLCELKVPATVFVNTAYLDKEAPAPFDAWGVSHHNRAPEEAWRLLTTEECRCMQASGLVQIGAHTHTHADHRGDPEAFREDVQQSVDIVRSTFLVDQVTFAFPFGGRHTGFASDELVQAVKKTGAVCGLTTEPVLVDPASDPFCWGRFNVFPWDTSTTLSAKLSGWYSWAPKLNKRLGRVAKAALCPHRRFAAANTSRNGHGGPM